MKKTTNWQVAAKNAIENINSAGSALAQLKANGKIKLDEDARAWLDDAENALSAAEDDLNAVLEDAP